MVSVPVGEFDEEFPYAGLVNYSTEGLVVREGVEVVRRVENPMGLKSPESSIGLVVEHADRRPGCSLLPRLRAAAAPPRTRPSRGGPPSTSGSPRTSPCSPTNRGSRSPFWPKMAV